MKQYQLTTAFICISLMVSSQAIGAADYKIKEIPLQSRLVKASPKTKKFSEIVLPQTEAPCPIAYCRGILDSNTYIEVDKQTSQSDSNACYEAGFKEPLTQQEVEAIKSVSRKYEIKSWALGAKLPEEDSCDPALTNEQRTLLKSIKDINGKISCQKYTSLDTKQTAKNSKINLAEISVSQQLEACTCISKDSPPLKIEDSFEQQYSEEVKAFIKKEYIANLYNARLYQYSLGANIFSERDLNFCSELTKNKELQRKANDKDKNATLISQLISPIGPQEAFALYNLKKDVKKTPPVIRQAAFDKFVQDWSIMTHPQSILNKGKKSNEIAKDALSTLTKMHSEQANFEVSTVHLTEMASATNQSKTTNSKDKEKELRLAEETTYLEKLLTASFDQSGKSLLNQIVDTLKDDKSKTSPEVAFTSVFKKLTSEYMNSQCAANGLIINALLDEDYSSINFDPGLIKSLAKSMPNQKAQLEKYHCATLQRVLETDPENFLVQVCEYQGGDLPPATCPSIGEFFRSRFVEKRNFAIDQDGKVKSSLAKKSLAGVLDDTSLEETISNQLKTVRSEHTTTFSSFVKEASKVSGGYSGNTPLQVKMSDYDIEKTTIFSPSLKTNPSEILSEGNQPQNEQIMTRTSHEMQTASNLMQGFQRNASVPQSTHVNAPLVAFENRMVIAPNPTPMPEATPMIKVTSSEPTITADDEEIEKVKTKTKKKKKKVEVVTDNEVEEEAIAPTRNEVSSLSSGFNTTSKSIVAATSVAPVSAPASTARSPSVVPEESARQYVEARRFEKGIVYHKDSFDSGRSDGMIDSSPPETGVMLNAFRTGKISGKDVTRIALGDEIKDVKSFEQTNTYHGPVVIVEDKAKNERYICRAFVTDAKDGVDRLLPLEAKTPGKDQLGGYKCTTDKAAAELKAPVAVTEKKEAQKTIASNERLYKAFVLDKIVKQSKGKGEASKKN